MNKIYLTVITIVTCISVQTQADLVLSGIIDGPLTGGEPKAAELYVINDIPDLSIYGLGAANNGGGTDGIEFTFSGSATAGDFLYVALDATEFNNWFGFSPDFIDGNATGVNGNDAIELFQTGAGFTNVIDVFGEITVDGTGEAWDYLDGWAYRNNATGPDGSTFVTNNWSFSGINALDGETSNASAGTPFPTGSFSTVPEPGTAGMLLLGGLAVLALRRTKR